MTATSHAGVGAVFPACLSPPPPGAASAIHGDLFFPLGSFLKTKLYCWRPQKGGSPSLMLTNAWPKISSLREPRCWQRLETLQRGQKGAWRGCEGSSRLQSSSSMRCCCPAACSLPLSVCVSAAGRCTLQHLPCEQREIWPRCPAGSPGAPV